MWVHIEGFNIAKKYANILLALGGGRRILRKTGWMGRVYVLGGVSTKGVWGNI